MYTYTSHEPTVERAGVLCKWPSVPWYFMHTFEKDSTNESLSATNLYWQDSGGFIIVQYVCITVGEKEQLAPVVHACVYTVYGSQCLN